MSTKRCHPFGSHVILAAVAALSNGCHPNPVEYSARQGNLQELSAAVDTQRRAEGFSHNDLIHLAQAVAERELYAARDPRGNSEAENPAVEKLEACAPTLGSALERRSTRGDDTAFAALLSLVEAGKSLRTTQWIELTRSAFGWARAVAARASSTPARFAYRNEALSDPDSRVRQAALASCLEAPAQEHWTALVALLRGAPDPQSRQLAARAIGILGGDDAYRVLVDAWPRANEGLRLAIVNAFAQQACYDADGRQRLLDLARGEPGVVGVAAAISLATGQSGAQPIGLSRITRTLTSGSLEEQRLAIGAADWSRPEQVEQLVRLGLRASDPVVQVAALGRWLERPDRVWPATTLLRGLSAAATPQALLARLLLAQRKDWSVAQALTEQQRYAAAEARAQAGQALYLLGDWGSVARTLADDSPAVRLRTACMVLSSQPRR